MRRECAFLFVVLAIVGLAAPVYPQCGPGGCFVPQARAHQVDAGYQWVKRDDTPGEVYLFRGGQQIGGYSYATGFYRPLLGDRWGSPARSPIAPPFGDQQQGGGAGINFGLTTEPLGTREKIWEGDRHYSAWEAGNALTADLPEDQGAGHVTGVAKDLARRDRMAVDLLAARARPGGDKAAKTQAYDYAHPVNQEILAPFRLEADRRFAEKGQVVIAQAAASDKEGRSKATAWYDYAGPDTWIDALRTVDPAFDPNKPSLPGLPGLPAINWEFVALLVVAAVIIIAATRGGNA